MDALTRAAARTSWKVKGAMDSMRKFPFFSIEAEATLRGLSVEQLLVEETSPDANTDDEQPVFDSRADDAVAMPVDGDEVDDAAIFDATSAPQSHGAHTPIDNGAAPSRSDLAIWAKGER
jgi:hypothetical protein